MMHQGEYATQWAAIRSIAEKIGCSAEALRTWLRRVERDTGQRPRPTTDEQTRRKALERENTERRRACTTWGASAVARCAEAGRSGTPPARSQRMIGARLTPSCRRIACFEKSQACNAAISSSTARRRARVAAFRRSGRRGRTSRSAPGPPRLAGVGVGCSRRGTAVRTARW